MIRILSLSVVAALTLTPAIAQEQIGTYGGPDDKTPQLLALPTVPDAILIMNPDGTYKYRAAADFISSDHPTFTLNGAPVSPDASGVVALTDTFVTFDAPAADGSVATTNADGTAGPTLASGPAPLGSYTDPGLVQFHDEPSIGNNASFTGTTNRALSANTYFTEQDPISSVVYNGPFAQDIGFGGLQITHTEIIPEAGMWDVSSQCIYASGQPDAIARTAFVCGIYIPARGITIIDELNESPSVSSASAEILLNVGDAVHWYVSQDWTASIPAAAVTVRAHLDRAVPRQPSP